MKTKKASGWIIRTPNNKVLILRNKKRGDWGLPKGHLEQRETELEAAYRELIEETGITKHQIDIIDHFYRKLSYFPINSRGACYHKEVVYFMAHCPKPLKIILSDEHDQYMWASWPQLQTHLTHHNLRNLVFESIGLLC